MSESFVLRELEIILGEYAERVASGEVIPPPEFMWRCLRLRRRGLCSSVAQSVWQAGSPDLLRQVEALTSKQIRELNAAAAA